MIQTQTKQKPLEKVQYIWTRDVLLFEYGMEVATFKAFVTKFPQDAYNTAKKYMEGFTK